MAFLSGPLAQRLWKDDVPVDASARLRIEPRDPQARVPLAIAQEPIWFAEALTPGAGAYNAYAGFLLQGELDAEAFARVLDASAQRHEILRTAFRLVDGRPTQVVLPSGSFPLTVIDRDLAPDAPELDDLLRAFVLEPFDLEAGETARALLARLGQGRCVLVLVLHHLVRDGWSMGVLLHEIGIRWAARDAASDLPALAVQYADYALWQRALAAAGAFDAQRAYWLGRLADAPQVLDLPSDRPRGEPDTGGAWCTIELAPQVVGLVRALAHAHEASFFMALLAAFAVYVHRCTGATDVLTTFPVSGRVVPEIEPLLGCFVNALVLRTCFEPNDTFRSVLRRVRSAALDAYDNRDYPIELLIGDLRPERRPGMNVIAQTMIARIDPHRPGLVLEGIDVQPRRLSIGRPKVDLGFELTETPDGGATCSFEYATALFDASSAAGLLERFAVLLAAAVERPDDQIGALPIMTADERDRTIARLNPPPAEFAEGSLHELFAATVARTPDAVALECGSERLTYRQLEARGAALAAELRGAGAGPGAVVGIYLDRGVEVIVAQLAVLAAGAAYLPLDPSYPAARIALMLDDAHAIATVTNAELAHDDVLHDRPLIFANGRSGSGAASAVASVLPSPSDLAYVMYTSGTTGTPKGVMIEHRNATAFVRASIEPLELRSDDRVLQFSALSFDGSIIEIWGAFATGSTLVLRDDAMLASPGRFLQACADRRITVVELPAGYWHEVVSALVKGEATLPPTLRTMIVAGDVMSPGQVARWMQVAGDRIALINAYGPTETTVLATTHRLGANVDPALPVSIGRPLAHARCYVLDGLLQPVPVNVAGELYVGGAGVGRGYRNDPELTAARFPTDPFGRPGGRMYRTGDRVRWKADGMLEFLGRIDGQVKLLGFRVEPGEIEATLLRHPAVREAVVVAVRGDTDDHARLAAFVTGDVPVEELRAFAAAELPPHLVPAAILTIDAIPLTPERKVDRATLRARVRFAPQGGRTEPATPVERAVARAWSAALGTDALGIDDDFFALGGHSLAAAAMIAQLNERFGVRVQLRALFAARTVRRLARVIEEARRTGSTADDGAAVVRLQAGDERRTPLFFFHGDYVAGGLYAAQLADGIGAEQPLYLVEPHGIRAGEQPRSVEEMAAQRLSAIRAQRPHGPYLLAGYCVGGAVAYEIARLLVAQGEDVPLVVLLDTPRGLQRFGPLREVVGAAAKLRGWSPERELGSYLRWQRRFSSYRGFTRDDWIAWLRRTVAPTNGQPWSDVTQRYFESLSRYAPGRYGGPLLTINSSADGNHRRGSYTDWSPVAPRAVMDAMPGDHDALVRDHAHALGRRIRDEIDRMTR